MTAENTADRVVQALADARVAAALARVKLAGASLELLERFGRLLDTLEAIPGKTEALALALEDVADVAKHLELIDTILAEVGGDVEDPPDRFKLRWWEMEARKRIENIREATRERLKNHVPGRLKQTIQDDFAAAMSKHPGMGTGDRAELRSRIARKYDVQVDTIRKYTSPSELKKKRSS